METPTVLEVETERDTVASVLGAVPGVAVDDAVEQRPDPGGDADSTGLTDRLGALWRQWGLLGTGVTLITLGVATVGFWVYRRQGDDGSGETGPESAVPVDTDGIAETPAPALSAADVPPTESVDDVPSTADQQPPDEAAADAPTETALATSPERSDDRETEESEPSDGEQAVSEASETATGEATDDETDARPTANVDPAPLLGAAFLIGTGAVGRWAARDRADEG